MKGSPPGVNGDKIDAATLCCDDDFVTYARTGVADSAGYTGVCRGEFTQYIPAEVMPAAPWTVYADRDSFGIGPLAAMISVDWIAGR